MRNAVLLFFLLAVSCKKQEAYAPQGFNVNKKSGNPAERAKNLNIAERSQIEKWIVGQDKRFYPMPLNYWIDLAPEQRSARKNDGTETAYLYEIYDFAGAKIYDNPIFKHGTLGRMQDLKAVDDAVRFIKTGSAAEILVPSVLAFGTYGDNDQITNDLPLVLKIKVLK